MINTSEALFAVIITSIFSVFLVISGMMIRDAEFGNYVWKEIIKRSPDSPKHFQNLSVTPESLSVDIISTYNGKSTQYTVSIKKSNL